MKNPGETGAFYFYCFLLSSILVCSILNFELIYRMLFTLSVSLLYFDTQKLL